MQDLTLLEKQAIDAYLAGEYQKSMDITHQLIRLSPNDPRYYTHLAECYKKLGKGHLEQQYRAQARALSSQSGSPARTCPACGAPVAESSLFCAECGAKISAGTAPARPQTAPAQARPAGPEQDTPAPQATPPPPPPLMPRHATSTASGRGGTKNIIIAILAVVAITLGAFLGVYINNTSQANARIDSLTANVANLEQQLAAEKASVASLQTQLTEAQAQVTSLTSDLATANAQVTSLTSDLAAANAKVASTQASLDKANTDLAAAITANTAQADELQMVKDPRHFDSMAELTQWLAQDDTNTNPAYASLSSYSRAFVLQVKALRDGYLLPACLDWDAMYIYSWNAAVVDGAVVSVNVDTDAVTVGPAFSSAPPSHPLPISAS